VKDKRCLEEVSTEDLIDMFRETEEQHIRSEIILRQRPDVESIVRRHMSWRNSCDTCDLEQEAWIGIMQALEKFDRKHGVPFRIYARKWAGQKARYAIYTRGRTVKTPLPVIKAIQILKEATVALVEDLGREPTIGELSKRTRISVDDVKRFMLADSSIFSISGTVETNDGSMLGYDPQDDQKLPDENVMFNDDVSLVMDMVQEELTDREKNVLERRLGLNGQKHHKLHEIAVIEEVTIVGAGSIFRRALEKLKTAYRRRKADEDMLVGH
jgi:RNA polymerase sigma factor (sigma-70 family)